jgi:N-acetylglucosamine kinase-like BadF-type ATPase
MRYVVGLDGGRGGATAVVADAEGCLLGVGNGGASTPGIDTCDERRMLRWVAEAVRGAIAAADLENARIAAACIGGSCGEEFLRAVSDSVVPSDEIVVGGRGLLGLYAVTLGGPGAVMRAGVGSAAFGRNAQDETAETGGWYGPQGDEGGGYWIALRALSACCRARDGIGPDSQLTAAILQHLEITDLKQLHRKIHSGAMTLRDVAMLSETVGRVAAQGDVVAGRILRDAGKELAAGVAAVLARLNMENEAVTVGAIGGVFRAGRLLLRPFREGVLRAAPHATILPARIPVAVAAVLHALEQIGVPPSASILARIQATLPRVSPCPSERVA